MIEFAQSSLRKALDVKTVTYASAGIKEYWVLNLAGQHIVVFRNPQGEQYFEQDFLLPLDFPDVSISVEGILAWFLKR